MYIFNANDALMDLQYTSCIFNFIVCLRVLVCGCSVHSVSKSIGTKQHTVGRSLACLTCKSYLHVFPIGFRSGPVDDVLTNSALKSKIGNC